MSGTSMAAPHVAGLAALLLQDRPHASIEELEQAIIASCRRPDTMAEERANHGVPDGVEALRHLRAAVPAVVASTPADGRAAQHPIQDTRPGA
jgi:subtilisin family serine protease